MDILDALDEVRALNKKVENIYISLVMFKHGDIYVIIATTHSQHDHVDLNAIVEEKAKKERERTEAKVKSHICKVFIQVFLTQKLGWSHVSRGRRSACEKVGYNRGISLNNAIDGDTQPLL